MIRQAFVLAIGLFVSTAISFAKVSGDLVQTPSTGVILSTTRVPNADLRDAMVSFWLRNIPNSGPQAPQITLQNAFVRERRAPFYKRPFVSSEFSVIVNVSINGKSLQLIVPIRYEPHASRNREDQTQSASNTDLAMIATLFAEYFQNYEHFFIFGLNSDLLRNLNAAMIVIDPSLFSFAETLIATKGSESHEVDPLGTASAMTARRVTEETKAANLAKVRSDQAERARIREEWAAAQVQTTEITPQACSVSF